MKASTARMIINPTYPVKMEGYHEKRFTLFQKDANGNDIDPMRTAYGARDDLVLDTVYLETSEGNGLVVHIPDIVMIEQWLGDKIKKALADKFDMDESQFLISCSHTHASPLVSYGMHGDLHPDEAYHDYLIEKMIENTAYCLETKKDVSLTLDNHKTEGYYCSRKGEGYEYFDRIWELLCKDEDGFGVVKMLNLGCHPTVLDNKNMLVSNDFFGVMRRYLQSVDGVPVVISNGEAGDISTRMTKKAGDWAETIRIGEGVGGQVENPTAPVAIEFTDMKVTEVPYTVDYVPAEDDYLTSKKAELEAKLESLDPESHEALLIKACFLVDVNEKLEEERIHYDMSSFIYDFGSLRIVSFPGEIDTQLAKQLRTADDKPTFVIAYSNGFYFYAVNKEEYGINHESFNSRFPYGGADEFVDKIVAAYI